MPVTSVVKDTEALTLTVVAQFPAPVSRLWDAYVDPRQLERLWGSPTYPARFSRHDAEPGGRSEFAMAGPAGDVHCGYWEWLTVDPQRSFEVLDGFAAVEGTRTTNCPGYAWCSPSTRPRTGHRSRP